MRRIAMKRLALAFLGISFTVVAVSSQANTYTVSFHNPGNTGEGAMTPNIIPDNATQVECYSGNCTSIPPQGDTSYSISSKDSSITWGTFMAIFSYMESSNTCDSGVQLTKVTYDEVSISNPSAPDDPSFVINVGDGELPLGLKGTIAKISNCATYK